ncbi:putative ribonuclease P protein subunit POP4 [Monocercomonoides exilis]|uniref:putative ribonuclease P protein subunit POP4 n=1 Tax=Monocercomonoides exilis TaxID=2049356 RepID=UPI0035596488|nr:putative ribonuclease P protein subunit POP4 [Monocercomonoides exilis]|eukprot:MONOS_582.1-p1 / transcript=MONOS_582.1 / gene=MONOS_582 / organism=Monocercomonoides_exilis_PA203 / gene_product=unspecified product / transcript_product=unspecified product / location=Mono_scaffold00009:182743-184218(-) / protein_length=388 / sequence_SO=supercontig / SO=protein_coding / is_pseudo=false
MLTKKARKLSYSEQQKLFLKAQEDTYTTKTDMHKAQSVYAQAEKYLYLPILVSNPNDINKSAMHDLIAEYVPPSKNTEDMFRDRIETRVIYFDILKPRPTGETEPKIESEPKGSKRIKKQLSLFERQKAEEEEMKKRAKAQLYERAEKSNLEPRNNSIPQKTKLSRIEKKALGLLTVEKSGLKYTDFLETNGAWKNYIQTIVGSVKNKNEFSSKMIHAEMNGAMIEVVRSKCSSLVGLKGIVIQETQRTFVIITEKNSTKVVPKNVCDFRIIIEKPQNDKEKSGSLQASLAPSSSSPSSESSTSSASSSSSSVLSADALSSDGAPTAFSDLSCGTYDSLPTPSADNEKDGWDVLISGTNFELRPFERAVRAPKAPQPMLPLAACSDEL